MYIVKFTASDLDGYGFDIAADRVVRFNKHPDGTYLNTRATYSINKGQHTHYRLREIAIQESVPVINKQSNPQRSIKWILVAVLVVLFAFSECSFEIRNDVTIDNQETHSQPQT